MGAAPPSVATVARWAIQDLFSRPPASLTFVAPDAILHPYDDGREIGRLIGQRPGVRLELLGANDALVFATLMIGLGQGLAERSRRLILGAVLLGLLCPEWRGAAEWYAAQVLRLGLPGMASFSIDSDRHDVRFVYNAERQHAALHVLLVPYDG